MALLFDMTTIRRTADVPIRVAARQIGPAARRALMLLSALILVIATSGQDAPEEVAPAKEPPPKRTFEKAVLVKFEGPITSLLEQYF
jgi:hypothetical protein